MCIRDRAKLTVAGKAAQGGAPVNVTLAGCQKNGKGQYIIPVELTFEGRAVTYTVLVEKRESVLVTLEHEQDVTVELTNNAGAVIAPRQQTGTADVYALVPGDSYTCLLYTSRSGEDPLTRVQAVADRDALCEAIRRVRAIHIADPVYDYIARLTRCV